MVRVSDDGNLLVGSVSGRETPSIKGRDSVLFRFDPITGTFVWTPIKMPPTVYEPFQTETITHLQVTAKSNLIIVGTQGYRVDPVYEPFFIHIYNSGGTLMHTLTIPDPDYQIYYINDLKVTDDGAFIVADLRGGGTAKHLVKVWELNSYRLIQEFEFTDEGPQCSMGLSGYGEYLAIGNLRV